MYSHQNQGYYLLLQVVDWNQSADESWSHCFVFTGSSFQDDFISKWSPCRTCAVGTNSWSCFNASTFRLSIQLQNLQTADISSFIPPDILKSLSRPVAPSVRIHWLPDLQWRAPFQSGHLPALLLVAELLLLATAGLVSPPAEAALPAGAKSVNKGRSHWHSPTQGVPGHCADL